MSQLFIGRAANSSPIAVACRTCDCRMTQPLVGNLASKLGVALNRSRRRQAGIALLASALLVASQPVLASADAVSDEGGARSVVGAPTVMAADEEAQLRFFFDEYGVAVDDQDSLLASYESGDRWLSMTPGAVPVAVRAESKGGMRSTITTYEDGSVTVAGTSVPQNLRRPPTSGPAPLSVNGCSSSGSARVVTHSNCLAKVDNGLVMMSFRFTWKLYVGSSASITKYSPNSRDHRCIGCIMSDHRVYRISGTNVRYAATIAQPPGEYLGWMGVRVSKNGASTYQGP